MATTTTKKLTGVDKGFFHCESEDHLMTVASCSIFHEDITTEEITNSLQNMANQFPKFRQKVSKIKNERYWESYNFQIDQHVHEISLPSASTPCEGTINQNHAELRETLSELMSLPLNEDISLWECHIIRIHSNRTAMFVRVHHAITDGQGAIRCLLSTTGNKDPSLQYGKHSQQATLTQNLTSSWKQSLMKIFQVLAVLFQVFWGLVTLLYHFWMIFLFLDRKHFKGKLTTDKIVSFTDDVDLNMVKDIKNHFNVSVNDVLVASLAGSFRDYLLETEGEIKDDNLLTYIPVSMRDPDDWELGNKVAIVFAKLPLTIEDPIERLMEVHKRMDIIKKSKEPLVSYFATELLGNSPLSDTAVGKWALQHLLKKPHAVFTNVPGPRIPLNYAGKTISSFFPFVPQPGEGGLGVALLSYANKVSCSLIADRSLLGDHGGITITNGLNKHVHNLQSLLPSAKLE